jgi:hypothetical protein
MNNRNRVEVEESEQFGDIATKGWIHLRIYKSLTERSNYNNDMDDLEVLQSNRSHQRPSDKKESFQLRSLRA